MKKQQVIFYVFKWIALVTVTILFTTEVHSDSKKIIVLLAYCDSLQLFVIPEGSRDFKTINKSAK